MKYKNYEILRENELNWSLTRYDEAVADKDIKNGKGEIAHRKGDTYTKKVKKGYYGSVNRALNGILKDAAGRDCEDLQELKEQIDIIYEDLSNLLEAV